MSEPVRFNNSSSLSRNRYRVSVKDMSSPEPLELILPVPGGNGDDRTDFGKLGKLNRSFAGFRSTTYGV